MTEKVIFEVRAEPTEEGTRYKIRRGDGDFKVLKPPMLFCPMPWVKMPWRSRRLRDKSRQRMRATLDFYEQMYAELYGEAEENKSAEEK